MNKQKLSPQEKAEEALEKMPEGQLVSKIENTHKNLVKHAEQARKAAGLPKCNAKTILENLAKKYAMVEYKNIWVFTIADYVPQRIMQLIDDGKVFAKPKES